MVKKLALAVGLGAFLLSGAVVYAAADPVAGCKNSKLKATGKKASDVLKSFGKNIKKPNGTKLAGDVSKAESKFTKSFTKAEAKAAGLCPTSGDSGSIEAKVNAFALDVLAELGSPSGAFIAQTSGALD
jgi:hypothetical protein